MKYQNPCLPGTVDKLTPKAGLGFVPNSEAWRHERTRPFVGQTGRIETVLESGLLIVQFPAARLHLTRALGDVVPAAALAAALAQSIERGTAAVRPPRVFCVELPLPPRAVSPNTRVHRLLKAEATQAFRAVCADIYREVIAPAVCVHVLRLPVKIDLDFYLHLETRAVVFGGVIHDTSDFYRPTDEDNARGSFKAAQDALVTAGVLPNDDAKFVTAGYTRLHSGKAAGDKARIVMTLTEASALPAVTAAEAAQ